MQPRVIDISHHNTVEDLQFAAAAGVWAVIHKASQGSKYRDPDYTARRAMAKSAGLRWGAYHFNDGSDVTAQVDNFLAAARPGPDTLLVLDFEDNPKSNMSIKQAIQFLRIIEARIGRKIAIYSGNRLKESIGKISAADRAYVCSHQLWLCQYGPQPKLPMGFTRSFLWQYTDGVVGPGPHGVPGIMGEVDLNAFNGTLADLDAMWLGPVNTDLTTPSSHVARAADDQDDTPPARSDDDGPDVLPPFLRTSSTTTEAGGLNVQPQTAKYDIAVEVVQRELDAIGYHEVGDIDGRWGGKIAGAIKAFFNDRGVTERAEMGPTLNNEIDRAKAEHWTRPIATERANAKPTDIAPKNESVRTNLRQKFGAKIVGGVSALGLGGSTISSAFTDVQTKLQPLHDAFAKIPPEVWFGLVGLTALGVYWATDKAAKAATKDYNTGRLS